MISSSNPTRQFMPQAQSAVRPQQPIEKVAFFDVNGNPLIMGTVYSGGNVLMTGYTPPSGSNILATDTVNQAIAKLDARLRAASPAL